MSKKQKLFKDKIYSWIKGLDMFGIPVSLTYKADPFIRSFYGGSLTLLARIGILAYLLFKCVSVFNRESIIASSFYRRNLAVDDTEYEFTLDDIDYAVRT